MIVTNLASIISNLKDIHGIHTRSTHLTKVTGRDSKRDRTIGMPPEHSLTPATPIIMRVCPSCISTHRKIWYNRLTPIVNQEFDLLCHILYRRNAGNGDNVWNEDFSLHSTYEDAVTGTNPWKYPNNSFNCVLR